MSWLLIDWLTHRLIWLQALIAYRLADSLTDMAAGLNYWLTGWLFDMAAGFDCWLTGWLTDWYDLRPWLLTDWLTHWLIWLKALRAGWLAACVLSPNGCNLSGLVCNAEINECASYPCKNGGTCFDLRDGFTCSCTQDWTGHLCETPVLECVPGFCLNGVCFGVLLLLFFYPRELFWVFNIYSKKLYGTLKLWNERYLKVLI